MSPLKYLFATFFTISALTSFAQNNAPVLLRWKIKPGEVIAYKTTMKPADSSFANVSFSGMFKKLGAKDSIRNTMDTIMQQTFKQLSKEADVNTDFITELSNNGKVIAIQMHGLISKDS